MEERKEQASNSRIWLNIDHLTAPAAVFVITFVAWVGHTHPKFFSGLLNHFSFDGIFAAFRG